MLYRFDLINIYFFKLKTLGNCLGLDYIFQFHLKFYFYLIIKIRFFDRVQTSIFLFFYWHDTNENANKKYHEV